MREIANRIMQVIISTDCMFSVYCSRNSRSAAIDSEQNCGHTRIELNYYELDASFDYSCTSMHGQSGQSQSPAKLTPQSPRNSSDRGALHRQFALHFSAVVCSVDRPALLSRGLVSLGSLAFLLIINNPMIQQRNVTFALHKCPSLFMLL